MMLASPDGSTENVDTLVLQEQESSPIGAEDDSVIGTNPADLSNRTVQLKFESRESFDVFLLKVEKLRVSIYAKHEATRVRICAWCGAQFMGPGGEAVGRPGTCGRGSCDDR